MVEDSTPRGYQTRFIVGGNFAVHLTMYGYTHSVLWTRCDFSHCTFGCSIYFGPIFIMFCVVVSEGKPVVRRSSRIFDPTTRQSLCLFPWCVCSVDVSLACLGGDEFSDTVGILDGDLWINRGRLYDLAPVLRCVNSDGNGDFVDSGDGGFTTSCDGTKLGWNPLAIVVELPNSLSMYDSCDDVAYVRRFAGVWAVLCVPDTCDFGYYTADWDTTDHLRKNGSANVRYTIRCVTSWMIFGQDDILRK